MSAQENNRITKSPINPIKIGVPKKGRLRKVTIELLQKAGYEFSVPEHTLSSTCKNASIEFIFLQAKDIPLLVAGGSLDLGITGEDLVAERKVDLQNLLPLGYGQCNLGVAVSGEEANKSSQLLSDLQGKIIATSFPNIVKDYFQEKKVTVKIIEITGSVEVMIKLGICDAIVDIVETGDTLRNNHLKLVHTIEKYQCALFSRRELGSLEKEIRVIKNRLLGIVIAKEYCMLEYNIKRENLSKAEEISLGYYSPTLSPLEDKNWIAVRVMVRKKDSHPIIDALLEIGATGILEFQVTNCRL